MIKRANEDRLLATNTSKAAMQWDQLLELQAATFLPNELQCLFSSSAWKSAKRVLDLGCGNGYYLSQLMKYFPDKSFVGIDVSAALIESARTNPALTKAKLWQLDFSEYEPHLGFDAVVLRLVVQHLHGFGHLFDALERIIAPGGTAFVIEAEPTVLMLHPATPKFLDLLQQYHVTTKQAGKNRAALDELIPTSRDFQFSVERDATCIVPQLGGFAGSQLMQIFFLWLDIFERSGLRVASYDEVREELNDWSRLDNAYCQIGFWFLELRRNISTS